MSKSRTRSSYATQKSDLIDECRAAYRRVVKDEKENITSERQLIEALQQTGRNPSRRTVQRYSTSDRVNISFENFCEICKKEKRTSKDDLMSAFRKIDLNGDGYISSSELLKMMTTKGEKMTKADVQNIIREVDANGDGKLDYEEFCQMLLSTQDRTSQLKKVEHSDEDRPNRQRKEKRSEDTRRGSIGSRHEKPESSDDDDIVMGSSLSLQKQRKSNKPDLPKPMPRASKDKDFEQINKSAVETCPSVSKPRRLKDWNMASSKGAFFLDEDGLITTHQYDLTLNSDTSVWFEIGARLVSEGTEATPDVSLLVTKESDPDFVLITDGRDDDQKSCIHADLPPGRYTLLPFTSGCKFHRRAEQEGTPAKLLKKDRDGNYFLTKAFKAALKQIYDMCDLDGNGLLNRNEFSLYNFITSGEHIGDDEWQVVRESADLVNNELTYDGFLALNQLEAEDCEGDPSDLWLTMTSMGFNNSLTMDECQPFDLGVYAKQGKISLKVKGVEKQTIQETAMIKDTKKRGEIRKVNGMRDLLVYKLENDFHVRYVVENKSRSVVKMCLDCSKSKNTLTQQESLAHSFEIPPKQTVMSHYLISEDETFDWSITCKDVILSNR